MSSQKTTPIRKDEFTAPGWYEHLDGTYGRYELVDEIITCVGIWESFEDFSFHVALETVYGECRHCSFCKKKN